MKLNIKNVYRLLAAKNMNLTTFAKENNLSQTIMYGWLYKGRQPHISSLGRLAKALDVDIYDLLEEESEESEAVDRKKLPFYKKESPAGTNHKNYARVDDTLLKNKAFIKLPYSAKHLLICMFQASAGKREFHLADSEYRQYGFNNTTFHYAKEKLIEAGFIKIVRNGKNNRKPNIYAINDITDMLSLKDVGDIDR